MGVTPLTGHRVSVTFGYRSFTFLTFPQVIIYRLTRKKGEQLGLLCSGCRDCSAWARGFAVRDSDPCTTEAYCASVVNKRNDKMKEGKGRKKRNEEKEREEEGRRKK